MLARCYIKYSVPQSFLTVQENIHISFFLNSCFEFAATNVLHYFKDRNSAHKSACNEMFGIISAVWYLNKDLGPC